MAETFDMGKIPGDQLVAFYGLSFAAAGTDGEMDRDELSIIFESLDMTTLTESQKETVRGYIVSPPSLDESIRGVANGSDELRYAAAVGIIEVLFADDVMTNDEKSFLDEVCRRLRVNNDQREAIVHFVKEARRIRRDGVDDNNAEMALKNAASGLTAVGVPIAAVYFSGSVIGLSAAGITSGLAALGLGLGMVPGIGIAVLIGTGLFCGIRWLLGDSKKEKEEKLVAERERKAQLVIGNLQDAINGLLERIGRLERKTGQAEANREAIEILRNRLKSLNHMLEQRKQRCVAA